MLNRVIAAVVGTRHERDRRKIQPVVDAINEQYARLESASEEELRGQTARFREIIRQRTAALESRIADLKEKKRTAKDPADRERIDLELSGADGSGGAEGELRRLTRDVLDELLPEAYAPCAKPR